MLNKSEHTKQFYASSMLCAWLMLALVLLPLNAWSANHTALSDQSDHTAAASQTENSADVTPCHTEAPESIVIQYSDGQEKEHDCCTGSSMMIYCDGCGPDCAYAKYPINYQSYDNELSMLQSPGVETTAELPIPQNPTPPFRPPNA